MPNRVKQISGEKNVVLTPGTVVKTNLSKLSPCLFELQCILHERIGRVASIGESATSGNSVIELFIDPAFEGKEHYRLTASGNRLSVRRATQEAIFWGLMTLDQFLLGDVCLTARGEIAPIEIDDQSRFGYLALMLNPARNFIPLDDVKRWLNTTSSNSI